MAISEMISVTVRMIRAGSRFEVIGTMGCLGMILFSLLASIFLTVLLNVILR